MVRLPLSLPATSAIDNPTLIKPFIIPTLITIISYAIKMAYKTLRYVDIVVEAAVLNPAAKSTNAADAPSRRFQCSVRYGARVSPSTVTL